MKVFKDQLYRSVFLHDTPKRIVSLVPSQTELLCDLGLRDSLVGVTKFCVHPNDIREQVEVVGGTKQIHVDKIKALQPDIILCNKEENTLEIVEACVGVAPVHISDVLNFSDCLELIEMYGEMFSVEDRAEALKNSLRSQLQDFKRFMEGRGRYKTAYFIWKSPWMVAASDTFINYVMELQGFDNYFKQLSRYPEIDLNEAALEGVELILLSSEPYPFKVDDTNIFEVISPTAKILLVDGEMFSWYGSRLTQAFEYFKRLHQEQVN
ncbi:ABC transporter substrate-binding protein [Mangrovimonas xylaniphaga]|uniref:ABC transporter substrate-binding protein n=1 Tax=Mangrovimonas xylaniphaga TaxID=1645915 RepID=UPI0006B5BFCA|nr:helical backbone metal receptor [Mangrovimonas xylaniphaga]